MRKTINQETINQIIPLYEQLRNTYVVAQHLGVSQSFVLKQLKLQSFDTTRIKVLSDEDLIVIRSLYLEGYSSRDLANKFKVSKTCILDVIKDLDHRNTQRIYKRDSTKFESIATEEDAYFLGLLFADGYNNEKHGQITLSVSAKDIELVNRLKDYFNTDQPIYHKVDKKTGNPYVVFTLNDKEISKNLALQGCGQAKTFTTKYPTLLEGLDRHFIRGYFDGDGSIYSSVVSLVGTESFLEDLNERFYKDLKINYSVKRNRHPERNTNIRELRYNGKNKCIEIYKYFYKDATIFLERKKQRFDKIFINHLHEK